MNMIEQLPRQDSRSGQPVRVAFLVLHAAALLMLTVGCADSAPQLHHPDDDGWTSATRRQLPASPTTATPVASGVSTTAPIAAASSSATASATAAPPKELFAGASYPPADYQPLHARTAKKGDGHWEPMADGARPSGPVMVRSTVHPHKIKGFVFVNVYAFDRRQVELFLVAGKEEPASKVVPKDRRAALVPAAKHDSLLAVFNGGFKARHGNYGMMLDGDEYVPPIEDACTVALYRDGRIRIRSWPQLASERSQMQAWRQTPPCLVEQNKLNPRLPSEMRTRKWGAAVGGDREIRRSAVGLDAGRRTLFYGFGDWVTATGMAMAMKAAGAVDVAQLDVNWSYTRFYLFKHTPGKPPRIRETPIPKLKFNPNRYISKKSYRDFFYLSLRGGQSSSGKQGSVPPVSP